MHVTYAYKQISPMVNALIGGVKMLSRDCDGCSCYTCAVNDTGALTKTKKYIAQMEQHI